jgi:NADH:ubiquinone oxidoreductase subunit 5 (subunit L)/multisubunit Na+/H+ antiporter MnhA subunit
LKKIIAYSTCSQLGFMFFGVGLGYYNYALFHLITHAIFKCLLFLCSGSVIHAMGDEQDIRKMGNLCYFLPVTGICMLIGTLSLIGCPMLSGYYSKESLLEASLFTPILGSIIYILGIFSIFLTSFYGVRVIYFCFFNTYGNINKGKLYTITESSFYMLIPMIILSILSIFSGYYIKEILTGPEGLIFMQNSIYYSPSFVVFEAENINDLFIQYLPIMSSIIGVLFVLYYTSTFNFIKKSFGNKNIYVYTSKLKFSIDSIYNIIFSKFIFEEGYIQYKEVDRGILEEFGPTIIFNGINKIITKIFYLFSYGYILHYVLFILFFSIIFVVFELKLIQI